MSDDLVTFVRARLDETAAAAQAVIDAVGSARKGEAHDDESGVAEKDDFPSYPWGSEAVELTFMAGPGHPARVLRQVEAMRAVLDLDDPDTPGGYADGYNDCRGLVITVLALTWSDHPDYREEWKP